jgi:tetratricopeptide (TPR) repeat protein
LSTVEAALKRGDASAALRLCASAAERDEKDPDALRHLAVLLAADGRGPAAIETGKRACALSPDDPRGWSDLGRVYAMLERFDEAVLCFREAIDADRNHCDAWHNLGTALRRLARPEEAFVALKHTLTLDPTRADTYLNLGNLLVERGQFSDALECLERAVRHDPTLAAAQSRLAQQVSTHGQLERAESLFRKSVSLDSKNLDGWLGLGQVLEDTGEAETALSCYRSLLAQQPGHAAALGRYLALLRSEVSADLLGAAHRVLDDERRTDEGRALIGYGLAKYHDRRGDYARAATTARAANHARRRHAGGFDRAAFNTRISSICELFDPAFFAERRTYGLGTDQPVFIVGLPRSGTTLTEQIVSAHPLIHGAGELTDLPRLAASESPQAPWRAASMLDATRSRELAHEYLRALRNGAPKGLLRITDKAPFNFFQLALAALLFPQARVIHCRRNARDNALSIWLENFNSDQHYATDFGDLACLRAGYERLMSHWRKVSPLPVLDVDYEALVADVEGESRRIVHFLGAPWDRRCLDFHLNERAVRTPSRWQVRERIYSRSVKRWRLYAPHLTELLENIHSE